MSRILRLALLAPDMVEAILAGRTDQDMMLERPERLAPGARKSNANNSDADTRKIIAALTSEVEALRNRLSDADRRKSFEFKL